MSQLYFQKLPILIQMLNDTMMVLNTGWPHPSNIPQSCLQETSNKVEESGWFVFFFFGSQLWWGRGERTVRLTSNRAWIIVSHLKTHRSTHTVPQYPIMMQPKFQQCWGCPVFCDTRQYHSIMSRVLTSDFYDCFAYCCCCFGSAPVLSLWGPQDDPPSFWLTSWFCYGLKKHFFSSFIQPRSLWKML
jgi:hypothetical protein